MLFVFLGLEWEEGVLEYYKNSKYSISTPSYTDTCKPICSNAVGRWQHYQYHMQPVMGLLKSHIERFGYDTKS